MTLRLFLLFLFSYAVSCAQTYYVAPGGSMSLSTSIVTPGDITFAFANAPSSSTVYMKAGNYGAVNLVVGNDSTTFIGYTQTPGDLDASDMPDSLPNYLTGNYALTFPTIDKNDKANGGVAITAYQNKVHISGIYIRNYYMAISQAGLYAHFENIIMDGFGDNSLSYSGFGLTCFGSNNLVEECFLLNAAAEGFTIKGNNNIVRHSQCYANDNTGYASTDYYFILTFNSGYGIGRDNLIEDCFAERVGNLNHGGHGFCTVGFYIHQACSPGYCYDPGYRYDSVIYNTTRNCSTRNIREVVLLRGTNTCYNQFINVRGLGGGALTPTWGCKYNDFINCVVNNSDAGVHYAASTFGDTTDQNVSYNAQNAYPWELNVCAEGNRFFNCLFNQVRYGIIHNSYSEQINLQDSTFMDRTRRKIVKSNQYVNCTFIAMDTSVISAMFYAMRGDTLNRMINCAIYGFDNFETRYFSYSTTPIVLNYHGIVPTKYIYDHCNFYNNSFNGQVISNGYIPPQPYGYVPGINNSLAGTFIDCNTLDPGFINPATQNFHLSPIPFSGTIDKGRSNTDMQNMGYGFLNFDLDSLTRPCSTWYDIGAYEYFCNMGETELSGSTNDILIYPNPCSGKFQLLNTSSPQVKITLFTSDGRQVMHTIYFKGGTVFLADIPNGIYFCRIVEADGGTIFKPLLVQGSN
ncbi:MAG: T9SS type A sorting domain-containing protein [Bacteroidia bacterium]|nr:T9SS type A sorting domain-containing protein [Bacteroidia bacterium]